MVDIAADLDRYELVPGVSAYRMTRIMRVVFGATAVIFGVLTFFVVAPLKGDSDLSAQNILTLVAVFGIPFLIIMGFSVALGLRGRVEAAAGYTTMTSGYQNLDQVDPVTGLVIRRAGSAVFTPPANGADTSGTTSGAVVNASSLDNAVRFVDAHSSMRKKLGILGFAIFAILIFAAFPSFLFASSGGHTGDRMMFLQIGGIVLAGSGVLVAVIFLLVATSQRAKLRAATAVRPDAFVFLTQRTPELVDALKAIGIVRPRLRQGFAVTLGLNGIELWGPGRTDVPRVALSWSDIDYVHPGRLMVASGNLSVAVLALHVFQTVDGRALDLPFPIYGRSGMSHAGAGHANGALNACARYTSIA